MPSLASFVKELLFWTLASAVTLVAILYLLLATVGLAPTPYDCITETRGRISGVSGFDFEISETDCDTLAKDAAIISSRPDPVKQERFFCSNLIVTAQVGELR